MVELVELEKVVLAISFCDKEEKAYLKDIEKLIRMKIKVVEDHPYLLDVNAVSRKNRCKTRFKK